MLNYKLLRKWILCTSAIFFIPNSYSQVVDQIVPLNKTFYSTPAPGVMFITPIQLDTASYPAALAILDEKGDPIFYKPFTGGQTGPYLPVMVTDFKIQPSGLMSYGIQKSPGNMIIYLMDTNFVVVDSIKNVNDVDTDSHDFIHLPDGTFHLVGTEERIMDCSSLLTANGIAGSVNATVVGNVIQRFSADKTLEFEWKSLDHFNLSDVYSQYFTNPNYLDHSHYNSIDIDTDGNYLLSWRHLNEVTKVDANTGEIIWRLGGKSGDFTFEGDTMPFSAQHDARRIANGNLTIFDNGLYNSTPGARAIEYAVDEENFVATAVWQFAEQGGLPSMFIGSNRRQSNGNTLIDWGGAFPLSESITITEVDEAGNVVMELDFADDLFVTYRTIKEVLPFELPRPEINCNGETNTLSAPDGYEFYEWNTGAQTQSIVVEDTGIYQVWVNQGIGYISSETFYVDGLENVCGQLSIVNNSTQLFEIYPNPARDKIYIGKSDHSTISAVNIYNQVGEKVVGFVRIKGNLDISSLPSGMYFLEIIHDGQSTVQKLLISK